MITRGYLIGEIIDELSGISSQVITRGKLGIYDLNVFAENAIRDILNILLETNLINLNLERSNEPGLDLGCERTGFAFQITSTSTSEKVNHTLEKLTESQLKKFQHIYVITLGKRQGSYSISTLPDGLKKFDESHIWDINSLCRKAMDLPIDELNRLYQLVKSNVVKLRIELEIPDQDGIYATSDYDKWEPRVTPKIGLGKDFLAFYINEHKLFDDEVELAEITKSIKDVTKRLSALPRITREFLSMLYERQETGSSKRVTNGIPAFIFYKKVEREYRGNDLNGELQLLEDAGFLFIDGEDPHDCGPAAIIMRLSKNDHLTSGFDDFLKQSDQTYRRVIGEVDFSKF